MMLGLSWICDTKCLIMGLYKKAFIERCTYFPLLACRSPSSAECCTSPGPCRYILACRCQPKQQSATNGFLIPLGVSVSQTEPGSYYCRILLHFSPSKQLYLDQGREFKSTAWKCVISPWSYKVAYHSESSTMYWSSRAFQQTLLAMLPMAVQDHPTKWDTSDACIWFTTPVCVCSNLTFYAQ